MTTHVTTFAEHFLALKRQIITALCIIATLFIIFVSMAQDLYLNLALPLLQNLPHNGHMIATSIITPLLTPIKFAFYLALFASIPLIATQIWVFISPGLNAFEKKLSAHATIAAICLFYLGISFAYFCVFPVAFYVFALATPTHVMLLPDMQIYLSFALQVMLAFGLAFQIPMIITLLIALDILTAQTCRDQRSIVIVIAFIIGMLITPPDVISQVMIAIPMCILYELGILMGTMYKRPKQTKSRLAKKKNYGSMNKRRV